MRYFTRKLYDVVQKASMSALDDGFEERVEQANHRTEEAKVRYLNYLRQHDTQLIDTVRKLCSYDLHDARIARVESRLGYIEFLLDTRYSPMINCAALMIRFLGVRDVRGFDKLESQSIVYEELYFYDDNTFEFSALCNQSEFSLRFFDVEIMLLSVKEKR